MNTRELRELVAEGESDHLEFGKSTGRRTEAAKSVCAMLNGLGGFVLFGVTDKGEEIGQLVAANTLEDTATELRRIEPPAFPDIIDWCTENANPKPTWHEQAGSVYVTFLPAVLPAVQRATRAHSKRQGFAQPPVMIGKFMRMTDPG